jgi:hypothetical protein
MSTVTTNFHVILNVSYNRLIDTNVWYNSLANIYELKSSNFDGYVKKVEVRDSGLFTQYTRTIDIYCYLVDDEVKLKPLKTMYASDWKFVQKRYVEDAIRKHAESLSINVINLEFV